MDKYCDVLKNYNIKFKPKEIIDPLGDKVDLSFVVITIDSLDDLIKLMEEVGSIICDNSDSNCDYDLSILIYDDYIE